MMRVDLARPLPPKGKQVLELGWSFPFGPNGNRMGLEEIDGEVEDLEGELTRLRGEGVAITMPLRSEEWGERAFQVRDPNGVIIELLDWKAAAG